MSYKTVQCINFCTQNKQCSYMQCYYKSTHLGFLRWRLYCSYTLSSGSSLIL